MGRPSAGRRLIDVTRPVRDGMPVYPGDPPVSVRLVRSRAAGEPADVTRIDLGAHTGTHVDAPVHYLDGGTGVDALPLDVLVGPAVLVDARRAGRVLDAAWVDARVPRGPRRLLMRVAGEDCLTPAAARALVDLGVRLVGVDRMSVGGADTHRTLLHAGVVILEGLALDGVAAGDYRLLCLPLLLQGADGAPARVVLDGPLGVA